MKLDIDIHRGSEGRPVVILIHGLGMDKNFWLDPFNTKVLGRHVPMKVFAATRPRAVRVRRQKACRDILKKGLTIGRVPKKIDNLWAVLRERGFNLICWSQRRPVGPILWAVEELEEMLLLAGRVFPAAPVALLCHSRGGLVARKLMERKIPEVRALITLATPHEGTSLSRIGAHLAPLSAFLRARLPADSQGAVSDIISRMNDLINGRGLKELAPGSGFFNSLRDAPVKGVRYLSFGGRKTELLTLYRWRKQDGTLYPRRVLTVPDSMMKIIPPSLLPDEIRSGRGDFMVTARSSVLPWAERHVNVHANHISITWNRKVLCSVVDALEAI